MSERGGLALGLGACAAVLGAMLWHQDGRIDALQKQVGRLEGPRAPHGTAADRSNPGPTVVYAPVSPELASSPGVPPSDMAPALRQDQRAGQGWSREELQAHHDRVRDHTGEVFASQTRDGTWAGGAELHLDSKIRAMTPEHSMLGRVECRQTICRVEVEHQSLDDYHEFQTQVFAPGDAVWSGARFAVTRPLPDGKRQRTIAFYSRDGHDLPRLPE